MTLIKLGEEKMLENVRKFHKNSLFTIAVTFKRTVQFQKRKKSI